MKQVKPVYHAKLVSYVAELFGKSKRSGEGGADAVGNSFRHHPRHSKRGVKIELVTEVIAAAVERFDGAHRPELAFGQQRQLEEQGHRSRSQRHAGRAVSMLGETPHQRATHVSELVGECRQIIARSVA